MWKATAGESWLVTAITHYQLDGLHSYRTLYQHVERGLAGQEELRIPFLVEVYSRCQRNAMFEEAGLPHRWIGTWSDPFVFLQLGHSNDDLQETADEWSLQTYRSPVGKGGVNPQWSTANNKYVFRFAIPTHRKHTAHTVRGLHFSGGEESTRGVNAKDSHVISQLWAADVNDRNRAAVVALEKLLPSAFSGPPALLRCTLYHENKVPLDELTCSNQMDCWLPLEDTMSGSLHVRISLSFQLMCSSTAGR
uniref:C2 domain-containing protein n=1 Tax=Hyaloperonospora arabidopsidis (strain Emoy2) TaxID=559515 RepID=M4BC97_HYAAE